MSTVAGMIIFFQEGGRRRERKKHVWLFCHVLSRRRVLDDFGILFVRVLSMKCCGSHVWWSGGGEYLELWREGGETGQSELMGSVIQN